MYDLLGHERYYNTSLTHVNIHSFCYRFNYCSSDVLHIHELLTLTNFERSRHLLLATYCSDFIFREKVILREVTVLHRTDGAEIKVKVWNIQNFCMFR